LIDGHRDAGERGKEDKKSKYGFHDVALAQ
jgi:hypothetical protein